MTYLFYSRRRQTVFATRHTERIRIANYIHVFGVSSYQLCLLLESNAQLHWNQPCRRRRNRLGLSGLKPKSELGKADEAITTPIAKHTRP
ncbi:hypothetical protein Ae201684_017747 [Aphanomyces euteiches]|nr:hypothetical protein Ae201684_017747 [Aphanomyces euteiches]